MREFTPVYHLARRALGLSEADYCFLDLVDFLARSTGWCFASVASLAEEMDMTRAGVYKMINRMKGLGLMEENEGPKPQFRTTSKWKKTVAEAASYTRMRVNSVDSSVNSVDTEEVPKTVNSVYKECQLSLQNVSTELTNDVNSVDTEERYLRESIKRDTEEVSVDAVPAPPAAKKEPPVKKKKTMDLNGSTALVHRMAGAFETEHQKHFKIEGEWAGFRWDARQFGALKQIAEQLEKRERSRRENRGGADPITDPTDDELLIIYNLFLQKASTDPWILEKWFTPCQLWSHFQEIVNRLSHGKQNSGAANAKQQRQRDGLARGFDGVADLDLNRRR